MLATRLVLAMRLQVVKRLLLRKTRLDLATMKKQTRRAAPLQLLASHTRT